MSGVQAWLDAYPRKADALATGICVLVAIARITLALTTPAPELTPDGLGYDDAARRLVTTGTYAWVYAGTAVSDPAPNAQQMPGYPVYLAALYALTGAATAQPAVGVAQALLSALTLWALYLLTRRLASRAAALGAVLLGVAYLPFWLSYRWVLTEELFTALILWTAVALANALESARGRSWAYFALAGMLLAMATYVRAVALVWAVAAAIVLLLVAGRHRRAYVRGAAIVAVVVVLGLTPWWIRNAQIYGRFVPMNTLTASVAFSGEYEDSAARDEALSELTPAHLAPDEESDYNQKVSAMTAERRSERLRADPLGYVWRKVRLLAISMLTYHPNPFGGFSGWGGVVESYHLALIGLAAVGAWKVRRDHVALVLLTLPIALAVVHGPTLSFSRYFYPMMTFVVVLAAVGLCKTARSGTG